jgi:hypothetical protein
MNERIQELAGQAGLLPREIGPVVETRHMKKKEQDLEKFAELIVRECVAICQDTDGEDNTDAMSGRQDCAVEIREHFGVEE